MAFSRPTSPVTGSESASPSQLTPRSKVKAMLAALDQDSDGEINPVIQREGLIAAPAASPTIETIRDVQNSASSKGLNSSIESEDDEEDDIIKPQGRLVGRMLAQHDENHADLVNHGETARERVRRMLLTEPVKSPESAPLEVDDKSDSHTDSPVISRKRKLGARSHVTPRISPSREKRTSLGGLFVSPASEKSEGSAREDGESDEDLPANPTANSRFLALVEKARRERQAKEAELARQKAEKAAKRAKIAADHEALISDGDINDSDDDLGKRFTQHVRPTRKASKKALEEMHKETQRMSRNMQLAHEARTKKKITKSSLFAKFNYKPAGFVADEGNRQTQPVGSSSPFSVDAELNDTPPTSPLSNTEDVTKFGLLASDAVVARPPLLSPTGMDVVDDIPSLEDAMSQKPPASPSIISNNIDKGKGKLAKDTLAQGSIRVHPQISSKINFVDDSDSDLQIEEAKTSTLRSRKESIFDRIPAKQTQESHSLQVLRMLARQSSPGQKSRGKNAKPTMTTGELHASLQQRARQQALREREEHLQALRDRGIIVQTTEEREKEMAEVEDLMAKARREADAIMKREKRSAKEASKANGNADPLSDSDDEDWEEEAEPVSDQVSMSGSEDGGDERGDSDDEHEGDDSDEAGQEGSVRIVDDSRRAHKLIDDEADNDSSSDTESDRGHTSAIDHSEELPVAPARRRAKRLIASDDEDEDLVAQSPQLPRTNSPATLHSDSPVAPPSVLRSATKTFIPGLTVKGPAGLGLTQIFAGTMDSSQSSEMFEPSFGNMESQSGQVDDAQDSLEFLRNLPAPKLPSFEPTMDEDSQEVIRDSQTQVSQFPASQPIDIESQGIQLEFTQSQVHGIDSMMHDIPTTQLSEDPEPTQDAGFQNLSPIKGRFVAPPPSTVDTVLLESTSIVDHVSETPVAKKRGRLQHRAHVPDRSSEEFTNEERQDNHDDDDSVISASAFDIMRKRSTKRAVVNEFDKKKSGAQEMVYEQAEESEDEYAGLGGNSDDDSGGEEDAFVKEMIDDEGSHNADERKLAAFYADKERANDEKQVERLFRDITNGTLRRKRGANYDLSDSDDDGEARRRMKQKEFAKMRKALLEDERIGKIAENPKRLAFLRALEDRGEEDEVDFLEDLTDSQDAMDSQSQSQAEDAPREASKIDDSQPDIVMGPPKRKASVGIMAEKRPAPHLRRTNPGRKPSNLSEFRESLSSLIEEPNSVDAAQGSSSDSDLEIEGDGGDSGRERGKENRDPFASRRSKGVAVVDRISLKRTSSSSLSAMSRLAFAAPSSAPGFRVPALLRRATTNSSISSSTSSVSMTERTAGGSRDEGKTIARRAAKNSGVNYFARENERRTAVKEAEKRREERRFKGAEGRRKAVGGLFGMGKFE
ncbi:MAG: hypothetical protein M1818_002658 [Claussenomyces sp. TS43310]|nr:MAG: hypothetical protein M1818_002658 [Claussenomyces sp. TS43310]